MSWRALFVDGPMEGRQHDRVFMGECPAVLYFAAIENAPGDGWIVVGLEGLPPDPPWPGQVCYLRNDERTQLLEVPVGEDEGWAVYEVST